MRRFSTRSIPLAFAAGLLGFIGEARAQTDVDPSFSVQRFQPAPGPRNYLTTRGARIDGEMVWSAGLLAHYGFNPLTVRSCFTTGGLSCEEESEVRNDRDVKVVENLITADLLGSLTPIPILQLGLRLPVTWLKGQGIDDEGANLADGLEAVGLGDPELEVKLRAHGRPRDPFVVGVAASVTAPVGNLMAEDEYLGDATPTVGGRAIIDGLAGPFSYAVNLGGVYRGEGHIGLTKMGAEMRYSAGVAYQFSPVFRALADGFGSTRFTATNGENALEALIAAQVQPIGFPMTFTAGGGTRLIEGVGAPSVRALIGVLWVAEQKDDDGDAIENHADQCPTEAEDRDGYEDRDGCPDGDNDLDSLPDAADKCPSQAEDGDGFEDTDGCPDLDNDKDGLADLADQCPSAPESKNNYKDADGCPDEADNDNDGVPDGRDKCPAEAEDTDGFEDTDGCPDPDNDKDGVLDDQDECIDEPETVNEFEDQDGCPDEAPAKAPARRR